MTEVTQDGPPGEIQQVVIVERIVLHKYEGDPTEAQVDSGEAKPLETVVIEKGEIVEHIIHE